MAAGKLSVDD